MKEVIENKRVNELNEHLKEGTPSNYELLTKMTNAINELADNLEKLQKALIELAEGNKPDGE